MAKGIKRKIRIAIGNVDFRISASAKSGGIFASALASEGYNGGYRNALLDVLLLLDGNCPCKNREFWRKPSPNQPLNSEREKSAQGREVRNNS